MKTLLFVLLLATFGLAQNTVTIPDKSTGDQLTAAEFNQLLDAIKDGTLDVKTAGLYNLGVENIDITVVNASTYTVADSENVVHVSYTSTGACTVTLSTASAVTGRCIMIKDGGGSAGTNTITINTQGSEKIDGVDEVYISTNYGWVILYCYNNNWYIGG